MDALIMRVICRREENGKNEGNELPRKTSRTTQSEVQAVLRARWAHTYSDGTCMCMSRVQA